jgi:hypothetical protein
MEEIAGRVCKKTAFEDFIEKLEGKRRDGRRGEETGGSREEAGERRQDKDAQTRRNHETLRTGSRISRSIAVRQRDSVLSPSDRRNPRGDFADVSNRMVVSKRGRECFEDSAVEENVKIMV